MTIADSPRRTGLPARLPILAPLRHRAFRLLFAGQIVSDGGDWLDLLALLTLIVYRWQLGPGALAALTMVQFLPGAVVGSLTGVLVDRWPRRATMIGSDLARAAIVLGLIWAPNLPTLLALVLARAICSTFFTPARQTTIQATVPDADLLAANALSRLSVNVTKVLGPGLGGLLVAAVGPRPAFALDAATFLVSAAFLSRLPQSVSTGRAADAAERGFWREWRAGAAAILARRALIVAVGALAAEMAIVEINDSLTTLAFKGLGLGSALLGLAFGASGLGNALGALGIGQWGQRAQPLGLTALGLVLVGGVEAALGGALIFNIGRGGVGWLVLFLLCGVGFASIWVPYGFLVQRETPPELLGRVSATANGVQQACGLVGPPLGAVLATQYGVGPVYSGTGVALVALGLLVLIIRPRQGAERS